MKQKSHETNMKQQTWNKFWNKKQMKQQMLVVTPRFFSCSKLIFVLICWL